jgi:hypothetical protein
MTTINSKDFYGQLSIYRNNPIRAHHKTLDILTQLLDGADVDMDPLSPFVWALDCTAVNTAMFLDEHATCVRRLYPSAAQTPDDLYRHMSDKDR